MALQSNSSVLSSSRAAVTQIRPPQATLRPEPSELQGRADSEKKAPPPATGFGKDTVSISSAALKTVDQNLENNRRLIPSVEQLRAFSSAKQAEAAAVAEERIQAADAARVQVEVAQATASSALKEIPDVVIEEIEEPVAPPAPVERSNVPANPITTQQLDVLI